MYHSQINWPYQSSTIPQAPFVPQAQTSQIEGQIFPRLDIYETQTEIVYIYDMPGVNPEQLEVEFSRTELVVNAAIEAATPGNEEFSYRYQERPKGKYYRVVSLPNDVDTQKATANFRNGLLVVHFPKGNSFQPTHKVTVHTENRT